MYCVPSNRDRPNPKPTAALAQIIVEETNVLSRVPRIKKDSRVNQYFAKNINIDVLSRFSKNLEKNTEKTNSRVWRSFHYRNLRVRCRVKYADCEIRGVYSRKKNARRSAMIKEQGREISIALALSQYRCKRGEHLEFFPICSFNDDSFESFLARADFQFSGDATNVPVFEYFIIIERKISTDFARRESRTAGKLIHYFSIVDLSLKDVEWRVAAPQKWISTSLKGERKREIDVPCVYIYICIRV